MIQDWNFQPPKIWDGKVHWASTTRERVCKGKQTSPSNTAWVNTWGNDAFAAADADVGANYWSIMVLSVSTNSLLVQVLAQGRQSSPLKKDFASTGCSVRPVTQWHVPSGTGRGCKNKQWRLKKANTTAKEKKRRLRRGGRTRFLTDWKGASMRIQVPVSLIYMTIVWSRCLKCWKAKKWKELQD